MNEQLRYAYDAAGNLNYRTNNTLVENFQVNSVNELTNGTNGGRLTVMGTTSSQATNVSVNGTNALLYGDATFASTNMPLTTSYTAIAKDVYGRISTNTATVSLGTNVSFQYDKNGNLTNDGTMSFGYDDENQLTQVWVPGQWFSQFTYDGKMRRRIRQEYTWSSGWVQTNIVYYVYDGNVVIQERDINKFPTTTYTRGKDLSGTLQGAGGIGGLLARTDNTTGQPAFYHADGNGNVTMLVNSAQAVVAKYLYDAFGNTLSLSGPLAFANLYRFSSKETHQNSGLVYYLYRYYDPNLQRWPNRDPLGEFGFQAMWQPTHKVLNNENDLYEFVMNSPTYTVDPDGRFAWLPVCCIACGAFAAWDIYDAIHDGTCAGLTGSDLASCLWNAVFNKAGLNELTSCLSGAILGGIQSGSSGSEIMSGVGDCFKCAGLKPLRDVGKMLSCGCCMGSILSRVPNPLPGPIRPVPQPAIALGAQ